MPAITKFSEIFSNMKLLYAEDDVVTQAFYEDYFKKYFNTVYIAGNGRQALQLYNECKPDIIVLDINMPFLSGLDVCKTIRAKDKKTKIILLTSRTDKEALLEAVELGLTTYLEKPVNQEQLTKALHKLLDEIQQSGNILLSNHNNQSFYWNIQDRELLCDNAIISLTKKEKLLLELLVTTHHNKVSYERIYEVVWFEDYCAQNYSEDSIKTIIKKLRTKLPPKLIKNAYGIGYYLAR